MLGGRTVSDEHTPVVAREFKDVASAQLRDGFASRHRDDPRPALAVEGGLCKPRPSRVYDDMHSLSRKVVPVSQPKGRELELAYRSRLDFKSKRSRRHHTLVKNHN
jgi:hypothetical protein